MSFSKFYEAHQPNPKAVLINRIAYKNFRPRLSSLGFITNNKFGSLSWTQCCFRYPLSLNEYEYVRFSMTQNPIDENLFYLEFRGGHFTVHVIRYPLKVPDEVLAELKAVAKTAEKEMSEVLDYHYLQRAINFEIQNNCTHFRAYLDSIAVEVREFLLRQHYEFIKMSAEDV